MYFDPVTPRDSHLIRFVLCLVVLCTGLATARSAAADSPVDIPGATAVEELAAPAEAPDVEPVANWTGELYNRVRDSIVLVRAGESEGTGFAFMSSRLIATAFHVIEGEPSPTVILASGQEIPATVAAWDPEWDLAILELPTPIEGKPLQLVSRGVSVGAAVATIGNPWGAEQRKLPNSTAPVWAVSHGIVSAPPGDLVQTDAPVNPGNSGGPLLTADGRVVGVLVVRVEGSDGISFAVGSKHLVALATRLHQQGPYAVANWWMDAELYWLPLSEYHQSGLSLGVRVVHGSGFGISVRGGRLWGTRVVESVLDHAERDRWLGEAELNYYLLRSSGVSVPLGLGVASAWDSITSYRIVTDSGALMERQTQSDQHLVRALFSLAIDTGVLSIHTGVYAFGGPTGARLGVGFLL